MNDFVAQPLSGFNHYPVQTCHLARPEKVATAGRLSGQAENGFIPRGSGRGFGDNAINRDGAVISLVRLDRLLAFDPNSGTVECEGGCTLQKLIDTFLPRGWFPLVTPGTRHVTVGGAIAADVHGKNHYRDGSFAASVLDFQLLLPNGQTPVCSREENADLFWATLGGMGLTGMIVSARLRLRQVESAFLWQDYARAENLDMAFGVLAEKEQAARYSVAWLDLLGSGPSLGRSVIGWGDHLPAADVPQRYQPSPLIVQRRPSRRVLWNVPRLLLNRWTMKAYNVRYFHRHTPGRRIVDYDTFFYPLDRIENYFRLYGRRGFVQYQAALPRQSSQIAIRLMLQAVQRSGETPYLAVLKTLGAAGEGLLSFPIAGHTLAIDFPFSGEGLVSLTRELDHIVMEHGGRVYLAKDAFLTPGAMRKMYPRLPEFLAVKAKIDPHGMLRSSMSRRLELAGAQ